MGVSHQYCGKVGKQTNCQIAVSLSLANHHASLPVAYQLYLLEKWASDAARRKKAGVPDDIEFTTKPKMARQQIEWACKGGLPCGVALMDGGYGHDLSVWGILKGEAGGAFTTTPRCASPRMDSSSPKEAIFPPADLDPETSSRNLPFPRVADPEAPALRSERHVPNSIATMRLRLNAGLVATLSRCPCCARPTMRPRLELVTQYN